MAYYQNKADGPRVFALKGGRRVTLLPGQSGELELARGPDEDPVIKGWLDKGELVETDAKKLEADKAEADKVLPKAAEVFEAQAKIRAALERQRAQELDSERRTPPRQFAGDGGPQQDGTVDGASGGALTPSQEEKGRPELPPVDQAQVSAQRHAEAAARAEKAEAEKAKQQPKGR
jgi:hypothetical protein